MIKAEFFGNISVAYCNFLVWKVLLCLLIIFKMPESAFFPHSKIFQDATFFFAHWLQVFYRQFCGCLMDVDSTEAGFFAEQYATLF